MPLCLDIHNVKMTVNHGSRVVLQCYRRQSIPLEQWKIRPMAQNTEFAEDVPFGNGDQR